VPEDEKGNIAAPAGTISTAGRSCEMRQELEAIEATMRRIRDLSKGLPFPDDLSDLEKSLGRIEGGMDAIIEKAEQIPAADEL
jgi:hypothetical protein